MQPPAPAQDTFIASSEVLFSQKYDDGKIEENENGVVTQYKYYPGAYNNFSHWTITSYIPRFGNAVENPYTVELDDGNDTVTIGDIACVIRTDKYRDGNSMTSLMCYEDANNASEVANINTTTDGETITSLRHGSHVSSFRSGEDGYIAPNKGNNMTVQDYNEFSSIVGSQAIKIMELGQYIDYGMLIASQSDN